MKTPARTPYAVVCLAALLTLYTLPTPAACPSNYGGMGALPYEDGVSFRVWAPTADSVSVAGSFNNWNNGVHWLCPDGYGYWSADVDGASVGDEFKYVIRTGWQTLWRRDPMSLSVVNSSGNSIVYDPDAFAWTDGGTQTPAWHETVIYELHIGTYNDPNPYDGKPATFYDAMERLDYLADLGINMVKVLPVCEFPGDYSVGYNPSHPFAVETAYGGPDGFKAFVNACHSRNIGVILDVIYNHWGPNDLGMWQFDGWSQNGLGGIYFYNDWRGYTPWGNSRPDYGRGEVRSYIRDNAMMWLQDYHVDGLRWDATAYIRNAYGNNQDPGSDIGDGWTLMQWINNEIDAVQPWSLSIAEDMKMNEWLTKTTGSGGAGFDSQWDPGFVHPVRAAITPPSDSGRDLWSVRDAVARKYNGDALQRVIYTESHDEVANGRQRAASEIDGGNPGSYWAKKRSTLGAALVLTSPGLPMLFQGQEILEDGWFADSDPVDWNKLSTFSGIQLMYKDLIRLRKNGWGNTRGLTGQHINVFHVDNWNKLMAYHRWDQGGGGDDVVVAANFANYYWNWWQYYRIGLPHWGHWNVRFNSDSNYYSSDFANHGSSSVFAHAIPWDGMPYSAIIEIAPYSVLILSQ